MKCVHTCVHAHTCTCNYPCMYIHIVVAVHSQDSVRLACANAVLAVHCNYLLEVPKQTTCTYVYTCMQ